MMHPHIIVSFRTSPFTNSWAFAHRSKCLDIFKTGTISLQFGDGHGTGFQSHIVSCDGSNSCGNLALQPNLLNLQGPPNFAITFSTAKQRILPSLTLQDGQLITRP